MEGIKGEIVYWVKFASFLPGFPLGLGFLLFLIFHGLEAFLIGLGLGVLIIYIWLMYDLWKHPETWEGYKDGN